MATRGPFERDLSDMFNYLFKHCPKGIQTLSEKCYEILNYEVASTVSSKILTSANLPKYGNH